MHVCYSRNHNVSVDSPFKQFIQEWGLKLMGTVECRQLCFPLVLFERFFQSNKRPFPKEAPDLRDEIEKFLHFFRILGNHINRGSVATIKTLTGLIYD